MRDGFLLRMLQKMDHSSGTPEKNEKKDAFLLISPYPHVILAPTSTLT
jgi:hypothetical protein